MGTKECQQDHLSRLVGARHAAGWVNARESRLVDRVAVPYAPQHSAATRVESRGPFGTRHAESGTQPSTRHTTNRRRTGLPARRRQAAQCRFASCVVPVTTVPTGNVKPTTSVRRATLRRIVRIVIKPAMQAHITANPTREPRRSPRQHRARSTKGAATAVQCGSPGAVQRR